MNVKQIFVPLLRDVVSLAENAEALQLADGFERAREFVAGRIKVSELQEAIQAGDELARRKALGLYLFFDQTLAARELVHILEFDDCPVVRHEAAYYLAVLRRPEAIPALITALEEDQEGLVRHEIAEALGDMGATEAIPALTHALSDSCDAVRRTARIALLQLRRQVKV